MSLAAASGVERAFLQQYKSPTPNGYETVWSFLAAYEPIVLEIMLDPVQSLMQDEAKATRVARRMKLPTQRVPAPPVLQELGHTEVRAFPLAVLTEVFPTNP